MTPESIAGFRIPKDQVDSLRVALADAAETRVAQLPRRDGTPLAHARTAYVHRRAPRRAA